MGRILTKVILQDDEVRVFRKKDGESVPLSFSSLWKKQHISEFRVSLQLTEQYLVLCDCRYNAFGQLTRDSSSIIRIGLNRFSKDSFSVERFDDSPVMCLIFEQEKWYFKFDYILDFKANACINKWKTALFHNMSARSCECPSCGKKVSANLKFCTGCGQSLTENAKSIVDDWLPLSGFHDSSVNGKDTKIKDSIGAKADDTVKKDSVLRSRKIEGKFVIPQDEVKICSKKDVYDSVSDGWIHNMTLTNKNLVFEYKTGFMGTKWCTEIHPLASLKTYKEKVMVQIDNLTEDDISMPVLHVQFLKAEYKFQFYDFDDIRAYYEDNEDDDEDEDEDNEEDDEAETVGVSYEDAMEYVSLWAAQIKEAYSIIKGNNVNGNADSPKMRKENKISNDSQPDSLDKQSSSSSSVDIMKAKNWIAGLDKDAREIVNFLMVHSYDKGYQKALNDNSSGISDSSSKMPQALSIEQQIGLLQKLKALLETGAITTEEYEKKKKEIL